MHTKCDLPGCDKPPVIGFSFTDPPRPYRYDHCSFVHMQWNLERVRGKEAERPRDPSFTPEDST